MASRSMRASTKAATTRSKKESELPKPKAAPKRASTPKGKRKGAAKDASSTPVKKAKKNSGKAGSGLQVGHDAPEFTLHDKDGNEVSLESQKGKYVVVYFYPKDNTPGCTKEAQNFTKLKSEFEENNAVVFGVSPDSQASHGKFVEKCSLDVTLLSDPDKKVMTAYHGFKGGKVIRSTVVVDPDGKIAGHWDNVRGAEKHPQEVLDALKAGFPKADSSDDAQQGEEEESDPKAEESHEDAEDDDEE